MRTPALPFVMIIALAGAPAWGLDHDGGDDSDPLAELLRREGMWDLPDDDADWVIRELVRDGFARSPSAAFRVETTLREPQVEDLRFRLARELAEQRLLPQPEIELTGTAYDIPVAEHPLVDVYIRLFTGRGRWYFERWLARADRYLPIMQPILEAKGLPTDTVYLAMIESGFSSTAYSRAAASGFWQFIASTGRQYKLRQDTWVDERRDFIMATTSAANYLSGLYAEFGDWHLAWAGYNAGGGRIRRALARYKVDDFWQLIENQRSLAKETQHYVPKIIAAAIVAKNREKYGFGAVQPLPPLEYDEVEVKGAVALKRVAKHLDVSLEELTTLNPALLYNVTPPRRRWVLRVPRGSGAEVETWLARLPAASRTDFRQYIVRPGDTLWKIADRYKSSIAVIKEFNGVPSAHLKVGQRLIVPSISGITHRVTGSKSKPRKVKSKPSKAKPAKAKPSRASTEPLGRRPIARHIVSRGDTLWSISQRYRVTVENLRRWNGRRSNTIGIGEVLKIF